MSFSTSGGFCTRGRSHSYGSDPFDDYDWSGLPGMYEPRIDLAQFAALHAGKSVLLTGAGGSIGSALAKAILSVGSPSAKPEFLILLENSEHALHSINTALAALDLRGVTTVGILGDLCDPRLLAEIFAHYQPQVVYHAAAFKHVPIAESNPFAVIRNNSLGTYWLAKAAMQYGAEQLVIISTDKAVNPQSVLGASKRIAELAVLALGSPALPMKAVRFGNVLGSQGSVVPLFLQQIANGGPVTVTHPEVRRYFLTMRHAISLIFLTAQSERSGIFIPELGRQIMILELAEYLIRKAGKTPGENIQIVFTELRPGDKKAEDLITAQESRECKIAEMLYAVNSPGVSGESIDGFMGFMAQLEDLVQRRLLVDLLDLICRFVPEFQPGASLLESARTTCLENFVR